MDKYCADRLSVLAKNMRACAHDDCKICSENDFGDCADLILLEAADVVDDFAKRVREEENKMPVKGFNPLGPVDVTLDCGDILNKATFDKIVLGKQGDFDPAVQHPKHYNTGNIEVWDAILCWKLDFLLGNVIKYIARAGHKGNRLEDLLKAREYINKAIEAYAHD